ncbi:DUF86 domain-containing protein [Pueribacillus sp. YX66]|uniref:DUF86 domain-containing protein n=1 Tax=Pueribacillus sp. YX66 TaxID=3229242 RepID=UPI00358D24F4
MYFVDRKRIEATLQYMETNLELFENTTSWDTMIAQRALERIAHGIIESVIDVGNAMIDGFIMRDPGSYEDIIDILLDENVIEEADAERIKSIISYRKELVQSYISIDHVELKQRVQKSLSALSKFPEHVRRYLTEELGPVSAFLPDDSKGE